MLWRQEEGAAVTYTLSKQRSGGIFTNISKKANKNCQYFLLFRSFIIFFSKYKKIKIQLANPAFPPPPLFVTLPRERGNPTLISLNLNVRKEASEQKRRDEIVDCVTDFPGVEIRVFPQTSLIIYVSKRKRPFLFTSCFSASFLGGRNGE